MEEEEEDEEGEAGWLVRWWVCSSGLPGMVRGLSHLSEQGSGPEPTAQLPQSPLSERITLPENLLALLMYSIKNLTVWLRGPD